MDLEVIWDGAHQHADRDLLCTPKIPTKRDAPPVSMPVMIQRPSPMQEQVAAVLRQYPQGLPKRDIAAHLQLTEGTVENALQRLMQYGVVQAVGSLPHRRPSGLVTKRITVYGLTEEAA